MSKLKQIRQKCLSCVDGEGEVRRCAFFACPLWPFRMSANPFLQGTSGSFQPRQPDKARQIGGSTSVPLETLRSWAGRNLTPETVDSPDPRELTAEELEALGCRNRSPARALRLEARANDMTYAQRRAAGLQDPLPPPHSWRERERWVPSGLPAVTRGERGDLPSGPSARPQPALFPTRRDPYPTWSLGGPTYRKREALAAWPSLSRPARRCRAAAADE
jgi:hypothetical protein